MGPQTVGFLAAAQSPAATSFSESSRGSGPTCVVGGAAPDCAGSAAPFPGAVGIVLAPAPVVVGPFLGGVFGDQAGGDVGTAVDVDRSTRGGAAFAR